MSIAEKLTAIAENQQAVYDAGYNAGVNSGPSASPDVDTIIDSISGHPIALNDVSDIEHTITITCSGEEIEDITQVPVTICGKNLCDLSTAQLGYAISGGGVGGGIAFIANKRCALIARVYVIPDTYYTFSLDNSKYRLYRVCQMDKNDICTVNHSYYTSTTSDKPQFSIITKPNTTWLAFVLYNKDEESVSIEDLIETKFQLERADCKSTYEEYQGETVYPNDAGIIEIPSKKNNMYFQTTNKQYGTSLMLQVQYRPSQKLREGMKQVWHHIQQGGIRTDYSTYSFRMFSEDIFKPAYDIVITGSAGTLFYGTRILNLRKALQDCKVKLDISNATSISSGFAQSQLVIIPEITIPSQITNLSGLCSYCYNLHTIDKLTVHENITSYSGAFTRADVLKNIIVEGTIAASINFQNSPLSRESIESILAALSPTATGVTLTLKQAAVNAAFPGESEWDNYLAAVKPEGWTVSLI